MRQLMPPIPKPAEANQAFPLPTRVWLTGQEAADYLGMSRAQFLAIAKAHKLSPARPSSQCPRYKVDDIDRMMDSLKQE